MGNHPARIVGAVSRLVLRLVHGTHTRISASLITSRCPQTSRLAPICCNGVGMQNLGISRCGQIVQMVRSLTLNRLPVSLRYWCKLSADRYLGKTFERLVKLVISII